MARSPIQLSLRRGRIELRLTCWFLGQDACVALSGGDREHIGAVAVHHSGAEDAAAWVLEGHREEDLAKTTASRIAGHLKATVCVACGIHVDGLLPEELKDILAMSAALVDELLERLG